MDHDIINENNFVIVKKGDLTKAFQVRRNRSVWLDKQNVCLDGIIGHEYGSSFEVKDSTVTKINSNLIQQEKDSVTSSRDNRALVDDGKSQKLTRDDIESLKSQGVTGEDMVNHLIANSATFNEKTEFSQQKYLKKKHKKYTNTIVVLKPNTRLIVSMYYNQGPSKILNMRCDSLGQILTYCNIQSGGKYLIFESCLGLVVGSVLERIGQDGCVIQVYNLDVAQQQIVQLYNFSEETKKNRLVSIKIEDVAKLLKEEDSSSERTTESEDIKEVAMEVDNDKESPKTQNKITRDVEADERKLQRAASVEHAKKLLLSKDINGVIIATSYSPVEPLFTLLPFLQLSRPFVIYCMYKEPLMTCYTKLKESGEAISLWLTETWMREYQVLPQRTHPSINMNNAGGHILSGIKVSSS